MPSDQSDMLEWGDELDHWSGEPGDGVRKGWSGTWSWWLGVLVSIGAEQLCWEGGVRNCVPVMLGPREDGFNIWVSWGMMVWMDMLFPTLCWSSSLSKFWLTPLGGLELWCCSWTFVCCGLCCMFCCICCIRCGCVVRCVFCRL